MHKFEREDEEKLSDFLQQVFDEGQEGLVVKDSNSVYEPQMRHWLKLKRDYLKGMADTADLIVLGD